MLPIVSGAPARRAVRQMPLGRAVFLTALGLTVALTGCSASFDPQLSGMDAGLSAGSFSGKLHGGQAPIYNAQVYVFTTGHAGYPGPSVAANVSAVNSNTYTGTYGNYVPTDRNGHFNVNGFTCTPGDGVYLVYVGGQPIYGTTNPSATGMAAMGICPAGGASALVASVPFINISEVSTAAMAYALGGFTAAGYDFTHISTSPTNPLGLANAFANAAILYNVASPYGANTTSPLPGVTLTDGPVLNLMANILADCVNSAGNTSSSSACYILFENATSNGIYGSGTVPQDTASAMINITHNITSNTSALIALANNSYAPYSPAAVNSGSNGTVTSPLDYTINFHSTGMWGPEQFAIDSAGYIYATSDYNSSGGLAPTVTKISPTAGIVGSTSLTNPVIAAVDQSNNVFLYDPKATTVSEYASSTTATLGAAASGSPFNLSSKLSSYTINGNFAAFDQMFVIGPTNNLEISNLGSTDNILNFPLSSGTYSASNANVVNTSAVSSVQSLALDGTGATWMGNTNATTVSKETSGSAFLSRNISELPATGVIDAFGDGIFLDSYSNYFCSLSPTLSAFSCTNTGSIATPLNPVADGLGSIWFVDHAGAGTSNTGISKWVPGSQTSGYYNYSSAWAGTMYVEGQGSRNINALSVDEAGNVWVAIGVTTGNSNGYAVEIVGAAAPTIQPLSLLSTKLLTTNTSFDLRP
jgi:hypothetical protein